MELVREIVDNRELKNSMGVIKYLEEFRNQDREMFIVIGLNNKNQPLYREICSIGILNASFAYPREIFKKAIMMSCKSIIIAHNHPSGNEQPSNEDIRVTDELKRAGKILNIELLDHIILGKEANYSFRNENKL